GGPSPSENALFGRPLGAGGPSPSENALSGRPLGAGGPTRAARYQTAPHDARSLVTGREMVAIRPFRHTCGAADASWGAKCTPSDHIAPHVPPPPIAGRDLVARGARMPAPPSDPPRSTARPGMHRSRCRVQGRCSHQGLESAE